VKGGHRHDWGRASGGSGGPKLARKVQLHRPEELVAYQTMPHKSRSAEVSDESLHVWGQAAEPTTVVWSPSANSPGCSAWAEAREAPASRRYAATGANGSPLYVGFAGSRKFMPHKSYARFESQVLFKLTHALRLTTEQTDAAQ
jgi:hypothetical protein